MNRDIIALKERIYKYFLTMPSFPLTFPFFHVRLSVLYGIIHLIHMDSGKEEESYDFN